MDNRPIMIEYEGRTQTRRAWAVEMGIPLDTFRHRYCRGLRGARLMAPPNSHRRPPLDYTAAGISRSMYYRRIRGGMSPEAAIAAGPPCRECPSCARKREEDARAAGEPEAAPQG